MFPSRMNFSLEGKLLRANVCCHRMAQKAWVGGGVTSNYPVEVRDIKG